MSDSNNTIPAGFRVIPGFPRYAIDENGTVISICNVTGRNGRGTNRLWKDATPLKPKLSREGYHRVSIRHDGHKRYMFVHALVLTTFVCPRPIGMECRHIDGNPSNNHLSNLAWGTPLENHQDKILHGTSGKGEKNVKAKLNAADVLEIRRRAENGEKNVDIAKDFHVTQPNILQIVLRKSWKHV